MRLSVNKDLVFNSMPPPHLRQNGHNCGFAVEMTRRRNRGKVLPPTFPPFPPRLETPQTARASHIPPATTAAGLLSPQNRTQKPQKPNPSKIEGPVTFLCRARFAASIQPSQRLRTPRDPL